MLPNKGSLYAQSKLEVNKHIHTFSRTQLVIHFCSWFIFVPCYSVVEGSIELTNKFSRKIMFDKQISVWAESNIIYVRVRTISWMSCRYISWVLWNTGNLWIHQYQKLDMLCQRILLWKWKCILQGEMYIFVLKDWNNFNKLLVLTLYYSRYFRIRSLQGGAILYIHPINYH